MVCMHDIGLAGLISDENYSLWVAMHGSVVRAHVAGLHAVLRPPHLGSPGQARFGVGNPTEMQRTVVALRSANDTS